MSENKEPIRLGGKQVATSGKFRLRVNREKKKFFATNLVAFIPKGKTKESIMNFQNSHGEVGFLFIDSLETIFRPDENEIDAHNVKVLIQHPEVRLEDMSDRDHENLVRQNLKKANPEFFLINLDRAEMDDYEEERNMIEINYLIMSTKTSLTKRKLMYISSCLNLPTRSEISDEKRYVAHLQKQLISYLKGNPGEREKFQMYYDKLEQTEVIYYIKELLELGIIEQFGGMYKIDNKPVGFEMKNIIEYFAENEDEYAAFKLTVNDFHKGKVTS